MEANDEEMGILFETGSGKYLKLIPGSARFHSSREDATPIKKSTFDDIAERRLLLDLHNVDWYFSTIELRSVEPEYLSSPRM